MNEELKKVREKLLLIHNHVDDIKMLLWSMSDTTNNALDLLDVRQSLAEWEQKLNEDYNNYAQIVLKNH